MLKKSAFLFILLFIFSGILTSQTHNAVTLDEKVVYTFLEQAALKGVIPAPREVKPYPLSYVVLQLEKIERKKARLSPQEQEVLAMLLESYGEADDKTLLKDGNLQFQDDFFPVQLGASMKFQSNLNLIDTGDLGLEATGSLYAKGDAGSSVSWGVDLTAGGFLVDDYDPATSFGPEAWEPYTFTKPWSGGVYMLSSLNRFSPMPVEPAAAFSYETEIAASFWDNRADFRFGRLRREWGAPGEGSLFLSADAVPFMAYEGTIQPFEWMSFSFLTGVLDYGEDFRSSDDYNIKRTSRTQQNMYSVLQMELTPADWLSLSVFDGGVYLKRPEPGYVHPLMSRFINQNYVGDFDNLAMGGSLVLSRSGLGKFYLSAFLDEAKFNQPDFFGNYGNMYSIQAGVKFPVPVLPLTSGVLQYTKIEPFTYTHYTVNSSPWYYDLNMETAYMNGGESLGYGLEPNSDEILLRFRSLPRNDLSFTGGYRMVRHGTNAGSYFDSWGSSTEEELENDIIITPDNDPDGAYSRDDRKDFLKDAVYEWFHIGTVGADWDLTSRGQPVSFGLTYSLVFKYYTDYANTGDFKPLDQGIYKNEFRHLVTFAARLFP